MCGFVGVLAREVQFRGHDQTHLLQCMASAIAHRGPDDEGVWSDVEAGIGLAHRRLAIVDTSAAGHQPMVSASGRFVLVYNGEVYNHALLRRELDAQHGAGRWNSHSDTEVLLAGFDTWGIRGTVERAVGMFAFALWDRHSRSLTLGRDRLGEKPLYYGWQGKGDEAVFLFGSELKALRAHPGFEGTLNRAAISLMLRHSYIPAPLSIYEGISKLEAGTLLTVTLERPDARGEIYWSGQAVAARGAEAPFSGTPEQAVDRLELLLHQAVGQQMVADVPLGAFLSGGVDSSTVVALMQAQSSKPVKTFTIGFQEAGFNEAEHALAVARHLGTDHTELYASSGQALDVIAKLPHLYDEPFGDSSQIPTYLVAQLARSQVTVSLSGDAGDELFCGYNRYQVTSRLWNKLAAVPLPLRALLAAGLRSIPAARWDAIANWLTPLLPAAARLANSGAKIHKGAGVLASASSDALYHGLVSQWQVPDEVVIGGSEPALLALLAGGLPGSLDAVQRMMALDMLTYLPDDILVKVDRASMGVSLESRVPFLDHRVVEFAWTLPQAYKLRDGQTKWALRQVLYRHVPKALIERPKMGFAVPVGAWLRGPLRAWAEALLDEGRLKREGYFNPGPVRQKWEQHLAGVRDWQHHLWNVLMFQAWLESQ